MTDPERANLQNEFKSGYKFYFNKMIFGQFNVIKNLTFNIVDLTKQNVVDADYINTRKAVLRNELSRYLRKLGNNVSLMPPGSCSDITAGTCYRYPDSAQFISSTQKPNSKSWAFLSRT
ncbi:hypothetical protein [Thalassomonas sp. RHCl1]|uniref:hypothetical protein n=1 Tax=Thalassomonas sp. RHCl1 TaxID=2995320 RepID=UPI00248B5AB8|nr:hypothetical protein [Thalassomonas sp. RHCl1]